MQVVLARRAVGSLADFLYRRQQQTDKDGDDGDHHQQFDKREGDAPTRTGTQLNHISLS